MHKYTLLTCHLVHGVQLVNVLLHQYCSFNLSGEGPLTVCRVTRRHRCCLFGLYFGFKCADFLNCQNIVRACDLYCVQNSFLIAGAVVQLVELLPHSTTQAVYVFPVTMRVSSGCSGFPKM